MTAPASVTIRAPAVARLRVRPFPWRRLPDGITILLGALVPGVFLAPELADIQRSGYFNVDDFDNVYWTYHLSAGQMVGYIADPGFSFFRPVGMFPYWLLSRAFNLDPVVFHAFQTGVNLFNAALVCALVLSVSHSRLTAVTATFLWLTAVALLEALWWFASIHYMLATTWFVLGLLAFLHVRHWLMKSVAVAVAYVLAIKSQETAVTLPAVLVAYELIAQRKVLGGARTRAALYAPLLFIGGVFTVIKYHAMSASDQTAGYAFNFSLGQLISNATWYAAQLFPWLAPDNQAVALQALVALGLLALALNDRVMMFGLAFTTITALPVIFLVEHHFAFYWYLSAIGVWTSVARLVQRGTVLIRRRFRLSARWSAALPLAVLVITAALVEGQDGTYRTPRVEWTRARAAMFRDFVDSVVAQPDPPAGAVINVADAPEAVDNQALTTVYRVLYDRNDIVATRER
jgi:hypothetical protein